MNHEGQGPLPPGTHIGVWRIVRPIGAGGMGVVYEAEHMGLRTSQALKVLGQRGAALPAALVRLHLEAQLAARVVHPNIVSMIDCGTHEAMPYCVMEYIVGESLEARLVREGALALHDAIDLLLPVLQAVDHMHRKGVVHGDLKPNNLMLALDPSEVLVPKVIDFSVARRLDAVQAEASPPALCMGTPEYMAPELLAQESLSTPASDQFALGVVLFRCLTGRRPFAGARGRPVLGMPRAPAMPLRSLAPSMPRRIEETLRRALHPNPDLRYPSLQALATELYHDAGEAVRARWARPFARHATATTRLVLEPRAAAAPPSTPPSSPPPPPGDVRPPPPASLLPSNPFAPWVEPVAAPPGPETLVGAMREIPHAPRRRGHAKTAALAGVGVALVAIAVVTLARLHEGSPPAATKHPVVEPDDVARHPQPPPPPPQPPEPSPPAPPVSPPTQVEAQAASQPAPPSRPVVVALPRPREPSPRPTTQALVLRPQVAARPPASSSAAGDDDDLYLPEERR